MGIDWQKQISEISTLAERILLETGEHRPIFTIFSESGVFPTIASFSDETEKRGIFRMISLMCIAKNATGLIIAMEAWMKTGRKRATETENEFQQRMMAVPPSESEARVEVLVLNCCYRNDSGSLDYITEIHDIVRDDTGKIVKLQKNESTNSAEVGGAMTEFMPSMIPPENIRIAAENILKMRGIDF